jgi:glycerophosphoryl diester phosphodiesterase
VFGHRGASARAPENTLAAFERALGDGADAIECDVQLCADGTPVILHDATVDRTTDGHGAIAALPIARVRRLDAGTWFDRRFRGERIPTLEEALEFARRRCLINLELKTAGAAGDAARAREGALAGAVAAALRRAGGHGPFLLSSFSGTTLAAARAILPRAPLALLLSRSQRGLRATHRRLRLDAVHPHVRLADPRRFAAARREGLRIHVWTVNDPSLAGRLAALGADGLMTDDPAAIRDALATGRHAAPGPRTGDSR